MQKRKESSGEKVCETKESQVANYKKTKKDEKAVQKIQNKSNKKEHPN